MKPKIFIGESIKSSKAYRKYRRHAEILKLLSKETPVIFFVGKPTLFSNPPYLMCTNDSVIIVEPIKMFKNSVVLPYKSISSCSVIPGKMGLPKILLETTGTLSADYNPGFLTNQDAQTICNFVLDKVKPTSNQSAARVEDNAFSDIEKLAELKDKGIISDEEFSAKKKQLLGL